ncbi:hypothetical protein T09_12827, partial [Trichinella sp. T9]
LSDPVVSFILFDTFGTLNAEADSFSLVKASSVLLVSADRFISHLANVSGFVLTFDDDDEFLGNIHYSKSPHDHADVFFDEN